jgi:4-amino-4-deoxy-L-arabinose transferase-like glycosyltransferase
VRASSLLWGGWTLVTAAVFSLMSGIFHEYYTVALAPGIAALVGIGGAELWRRREHVAARAALAAVVAGTAAWAVVLLLRTPDLTPALPWATAALGLLAAVALLVGRRIAPAGLVAAVVAASLGPAAYAVDTASSARTGSIVLAGPATAGGPGGMVRPAGGDGGGGPDGGGAFGTAPGGPELTALLRAAGTTWSAATPSTASSAQLALDSGTDVIGIGGFSGSDPAPTLEQFQALVAAGEVRYYVPGGAGGGPGGGAVDPQQLLEQLPPVALEDPQLVEALESGQLPGGRGGSEIETWVEETFTAVTVGGTTVYDLADPA